MNWQWIKNASRNRRIHTKKYWNIFFMGGKKSMNFKCENWSWSKNDGILPSGRFIFDCAFGKWRRYWPTHTHIEALIFHSQSKWHVPKQNFHTIFSLPLALPTQFVPNAKKKLSLFIVQHQNKNAILHILCIINYCSECKLEWFVLLLLDRVEMVLNLNWMKCAWKKHLFYLKRNSM